MDDSETEPQSTKKRAAKPKVTAKRKARHKSAIRRKVIVKRATIVRRRATARCKVIARHKAVTKHWLIVKCRATGKTKKRRLTKAELNQIVDELTLFDDALARLVFKDIDVVQLVLQAVLNRNVDLITTEAQKEFYLSVGGKRFVLDSFSVGKDGDLFNVEVQRDNSDAPLIRAFYHHVAIASSPAVSLQKGESCEDAPNIWVIFICEKDPYKEGQPFYYFESFHREGLPGLEKVNTLYVNGEFRDDSPFGWLMHDLNCNNPEDMHFQLLVAIVEYLKTTQGGRRKLKESVRRFFGQQPHS